MTLTHRCNLKSDGYAEIYSVQATLKLIFWLWAEHIVVISFCPTIEFVKAVTRK